MEVSDLFKLEWDNNKMSINATLIKQYDVGDVLTYSTYLPGASSSL